MVARLVPRSPAVGPGTLVAGRYRVEQLLGKGGMGTVYAATHEALGQRVAIKILTDLSDTDLRRFELEARASARLRSVHATRTFDVGRLADGRPYMIMDYLEGHDLAAILDASAPLPISTAVDYVTQACEVLVEAHSLGMIHRDLKPGNLFLTKTTDGRSLVKVLDFGITKIAGVSEELELTATNQILGSPLYMSPEQILSSRNVDARTDIWGLGVILYELITKQRPFDADTVAKLAVLVSRDPHTPLHQIDRSVPQQLSAIVDRCLAKAPEDRFQSASELVTALAPFRNSPESLGAAAPTPPPRRTAGDSRPSLTANLADTVPVTSLATRPSGPLDAHIPPTAVTNGASPSRRQTRHRAVFATLAVALAVTGVAIALPRVMKPRPSESPPTAASASPLSNAIAATSAGIEGTAEAPLGALVSAPVPSAAVVVAPTHTIGRQPRPRPASSTTPAASVHSREKAPAAMTASAPSLYGEE